MKKINKKKLIVNKFRISKLKNIQMLKIIGGTDDGVSNTDVSTKVCGVGNNG